ncbi:MAG: pantetheine-phosphate adenylyltransferase [Clostridia bacterium]|nr:pantetheine-phosphate adenylyltransferase [Clostridia bacterium]
MKTAIVPGSFDPVSKGHIDLITRAAKAFDTVYAACLINENKQYTFTIDQREEMLRASLKDVPNVIVESFTGWMYEYILLKKADAVVKGIRSEKDFIYEKEHADFNKEHSGVDTFLIITDPDLKDVSSTAIRQALENGGDISHLVPEAALHLIKEYYGG